MLSATTPLAAVASAAADAASAASAAGSAAATASTTAATAAAAAAASTPLPDDLRERAAVGRSLVADVLRASRAYDVMPDSGKIVVFDVEIPLRFAYYALVEHDAACAPLWDAARGRFCGTLTAADICDIMRVFHIAGTQTLSTMLGECTIAAWRQYAGSMGGMHRGLSTPEMRSLLPAAAAAASGRRQRSSGGGGGGAAARRHRRSGPGARGSGSPSATASGGGGGSQATAVISDSSDGDGLDAAASFGSVGGGDRSGGDGLSPTSLAAHLDRTQPDGDGDVAMAGAGERAAAGDQSARLALHSGASGATVGRAIAPGGGPGSGGRVQARLISVHPEDDLLQVARKLRQHGIHHMPVLDTTGDQAAVLAILSYRHLLRHLLDKFLDRRPLFEASLVALGIGSFGEDIVVVPETASIISVLHVLAERRISSVPIVTADGSNTVVDLFSRDDVGFLANDPTLMVLDAPVGDVKRAQLTMVGAVPRSRFAADSLSLPLRTCTEPAQHPA